MSAEEKFKKPPYYLTWWFEGAVLTLCFFVGWLLWTFIDAPWTQHEAASNQFIELAQSLAQGHGYTLAQGGLHMPYLETPPLYPGLLALLMFGRHTIDTIALTTPFLALNLGLYLVSIILVYQFSKQRLKRPYPFFVTTLYTLSPLTLAAVESMTPELTYLVLSLMALISIDTFLAKKSSKIRISHILWCGLWVVATLMTKNLGIALLAAFIGINGYKLGLKRALIIAGVMALILSPWYIRELVHRSGSTFAYKQFTEQVDPELKGVSPLKDMRHFGKRVTHNTNTTMATITHSLLGELNADIFYRSELQTSASRPWSFRFSRINWVCWLVSAIILLGVTLGLYQYSGVASLYLLIFTVLNIFFPDQHRLSVFPMFPLLLFFLFKGLMWISFGFNKMLHLPVARIAVPLFASVIALNSINTHANHLPNSIDGLAAQRKTLRGAPARQELLTVTSQETQSYQKAMRWIRLNTAKNAHIVGEKPKKVYQHSRRQSQAINPTIIHPYAHREIMLNSIEKPYYLLDSGSAKATTLIDRLNQNKSLLQLVYNDRRADIKIWRLNP